MPLFVCEKCKTIDNTALAHFWTRGLGYFKDTEKDKQALCCVCMPDDSICAKAGKWHNYFPQTIATPEVIKEMGEDNFVFVADIPGVKAMNCCTPKKSLGY